MIQTLLLLILSLAIVVVCANYLVEGASGIAKKAGMSEFLIGALIVGFGTSMPEFVVSIVGSIEQNSDVSIGNVIGSNIFNAALILGLSALITPIVVTEKNIKKDLPILFLSTVLFIGVCKTKQCVTLYDGILLLIIFLMYVGSSIQSDENDYDDTSYNKPLWKYILWTVLSIIGLSFGGKLFVDSGVKFGHLVGVSDKVIAITVLAFGTSLPELASCIAAIAKHKSQMALGDIVGSNMFNMMLIIGTASVIHPISTVNVTVFDYAALSGCTLILLLSQYTKHAGKVNRLDGSLLLILFLAFMTMLFLK